MSNVIFGVGIRSLVVLILVEVKFLRSCTAKVWVSPHRGVSIGVSIGVGDCVQTHRRVEKILPM